MNRPWMIAGLGTPCRVLGWSLNRPGFVTTRRSARRGVRNADPLPAWLGRQGP